MIIPTVTERRLAEGKEGEHMAANVTVFIHYEWEAIKTQPPEYIRTDLCIIISRYIYVPREFKFYIYFYFVCWIKKKKHNLDFIVFCVQVRFASPTE